MQNEYGAILKDFFWILSGKIILKGDIDFKDLFPERRRSVAEPPEIGQVASYDSSNRLNLVERKDDTEHNFTTPHASLSTKQGFADEST